MKIITPGRIPENIEIRAKCNYCKTVFEFTTNEATIRSNRLAEFYQVSCPMCGKLVTKSTRSND